MRTSRCALLALLAALALPVAVAAADVTFEKAREIALAQAGGSGTVVDAEIDTHRGGGVTYEFEIVTDDAKIEVDVDAATGAVTEFSREIRRPSRAAGAKLTATAAQELAVKEAGGGEVSRYELDRDDGRLVHEVTVLNAGKRYRLEIDDATGTVNELSVRNAQRQGGQRQGRR